MSQKWPVKQQPLVVLLAMVVSQSSIHENKFTPCNMQSTSRWPKDIHTGWTSASNKPVQVYRHQSVQCTNEMFLPAACRKCSSFSLVFQTGPLRLSTVLHHFYGLSCASDSSAISCIKLNTIKTSIRFSLPFLKPRLPDETDWPSAYATNW